MKSGRLLTLVLALSIIAWSSQSCTVVKIDNGKHKGWFKNSNNPHHPFSTNPGKKKGNSSKNKGKGKKG